MNGASTEHRSSRRRAQARHGLPSSRGLYASAAFLAFALAVDVDALRSVLAKGFEAAFAVASGTSTFASLSGVAMYSNGRALLSILGPLLAASVAGVLVCGIAQRAAGGLGQPAGARGEGPARFDPAARMRELLDAERALDGLFALAALTVLATVAWLTIGPSVRGLLALPAADVSIAAPRVLELLGTLAFRLTLAGLGLGALDYLQRRIRYARRSRATPRELRDEQREQYGDPQVRAERARRMRSAARRAS